MIFEEQIARKPDHYRHITQKYIRALHENPWSDKEFTFEKDIQDFKVRCDDQKRQMIIRSTSCISQIEVDVKTYWAKIGDTLQHPSIRDLGYVNANVEVIHNNAYERLLDVLDLNDVFHENLQIPVLKRRVNYLKKYTHKYYNNQRQQFVYSLVLFTLFTEYVSLFSQFYTIYYFERFHKMFHDAAQQVAYTSREEQLHAFAGIELIRQIREEHPELFTSELEERIREEAVEAYKAEKKIIEWILCGYESDNLSPHIVDHFIKERIDDALKLIHFKPVFKGEIDKKALEATSWFYEDVLADVSMDFFFKRPTEYSKSDQPFDSKQIFEGMKKDDYTITK